MNVELQHFTFKHRESVYEQVVMNKGKRKLEVMLSPTGRSVHVHVDGVRWGPVGEQ